MSSVLFTYNLHVMWYKPPQYKRICRENASNALRDELLTVSIHCDSLVFVVLLELLTH